MIKIDRSRGFASPHVRPAAQAIRFSPQQAASDRVSLRFGGAANAPDEARLEEFKEVQRNTELFLKTNELLSEGAEAYDAEKLDEALGKLTDAKELIQHMSFGHPDHANYPREYFTKSTERQMLERRKLQLKVMTLRMLGDVLRDLDEPDAALHEYQLAMPAAHALARENHQRMWEPKSLYARMAQSHILKGDYPTALFTLTDGMRELARYRDPILHDEEIPDEDDLACNYMAEELTHALMAQIYLEGMSGHPKSLEMGLKENDLAMTAKEKIAADPKELVELLNQRASILRAMDRYEEADQINRRLEQIESGTPQGPSDQNSTPLGDDGTPLDQEITFTPKRRITVEGRNITLDPDNPFSNN